MECLALVHSQEPVMSLHEGYVAEVDYLDEHAQG